MGKVFKQWLGPPPPEVLGFRPRVKDAGGNVL